MSPALFIPRYILVGFAARKIPRTEMTDAFVRYIRPIQKVQIHLLNKGETSLHGRLVRQCPDCLTCSS
jgi:hypothetical protein